MGMKKILTGKKKLTKGKKCDKIFLTSKCDIFIGYCGTFTHFRHFSLLLKKKTTSVFLDSILSSDTSVQL